MSAKIGNLEHSGAGKGGGGNGRHGEGRDVEARLGDLADLFEDDAALIWGGISILFQGVIRPQRGTSLFEKPNRECDHFVPCIGTRFITPRPRCPRPRC
jgi:hypothetical protein